MRQVLTEFAGDATGLLVDGAWRAPAETVAVADKFTGETVRTVADATPAEVDAAVAGATRAASDPLSADERRRVLETAAGVLAAHEAEIVDAYVAETGPRRGRLHRVRLSTGVHRLHRADRVRTGRRRTGRAPAGRRPGRVARRGLRPGAAAGAARMNGPPPAAHRDAALLPGISRGEA